MINVQEIMSDPDFVRSFSVKRPSGAFDDTGVFAISGYDDIAFTGAVQPADPATLQMLGEGERIGNVIEIWTLAEVRMGQGADNVLSDIVIVDGQSFRVFKTEPWSDNGYFHAFAEGFLPGASS